MSIEPESSFRPLVVAAGNKQFASALDRLRDKAKGGDTGAGVAFVSLCKIPALRAVRYGASIEPTTEKRPRPLVIRRYCVILDHAPQ